MGTTPVTDLQSQHKPTRESAKKCEPVGHQLNWSAPLLRSR